jgi:hypothetical protein
MRLQHPAIPSVRDQVEMERATLLEIAVDLLAAPPPKNNFHARRPQPRQLSGFYCSVKTISPIGPSNDTSRKAFVGRSACIRRLQVWCRAGARLLVACPYKLPLWH